MELLTDNALILIIAVMAVTTLATRLAPFLLFQSSGSQPQALKYAGHFLPMMIMVVLVVYSFKGVEWLGPRHGIPEIAGAAVTAILQIYVKHVLLSIGCGVITYAVISRLLL